MSYRTTPPGPARTAAAAGIALIASMANVGGIVGPALIGRMKDLSGGYRGSFLLLAGFAVAAGSLTLTLRKSSIRGKPGSA